MWDEEATDGGKEIPQGALFCALRNGAFFVTDTATVVCVSVLLHVYCATCGNEWIGERAVTNST